MHPEFVTIAQALTMIDGAVRSLREKQADINYLSMDGFAASVKQTRESFKVVTMSRTIEETNGKLD